jgi:hypothetical protein
MPTIPKPSEVWEYDLSEWSSIEKNRLEVWLGAVVICLLLIDPEISDDVINRVRNILRKSKEGLISNKETIQNLMPLNLFSEKELKKMEDNAKKFKDIKIHESQSIQ